MPGVVGAFFQLDSLQFAAACAVEDAQLYLFSVLGEEGEVDAFAVEGGAAWIGVSWPHGGNGFFMRASVGAHVGCLRGGASRMGGIGTQWGVCVGVHG